MKRVHPGGPLALSPETQAPGTTAIGRRTFLRRAGSVAGLGLLTAGCGGITLPTFPGGGGTPTPGQAPLPGGFGSGPVRVALLLPLSAQGNAGVTATGLRNAAELAIADIAQAPVTIVPIDTKGTPEGANAAAQQAVGTGARLILGPLFSAEVAAAGRTAQASGIPVIAFSSDPNAAGANVRLLSFLAESDINRIVFYAAQNNRRSFGALLPESSYGVIVENALRQAVSRNGGQLIAVERYKPDNASIAAATGRMAAIAGGATPRVNALLIPDGASAMPAILNGLQTGRVDPQRVKLLGSGQWSDGAVLRQPLLAGAWFPAPDPSGFNGLSARYRTRYGGNPPRIASLSYDAARLAAVLAGLDQTNPFTDARLSSRDGFQGTDGIFRFGSDGRSERGLAVLEVQPPSSRVLQAAPQTFAGSGF